MKPILTGDGSHTLFVPELNESYHSVHGAIGESMEVFVRPGLEAALKQHAALNILEMGFGTGLNALLTLGRTAGTGVKVYYLGIEADPVPLHVAADLNYPSLTGGPEDAALFRKLHECPWNEPSGIADNFFLEKRKGMLQESELPDSYFHLVYYDAFSPAVQPELWTEQIFVKVYNAMTPHGILVTYSAKGSVRRAMKSAGFRVEKLPGPPGKREITRAVKY